MAGQASSDRSFPIRGSGLSVWTGQTTKPINWPVSWWCSICESANLGWTTWASLGHGFGQGLQQGWSDAGADRFVPSTLCRQLIPPTTGSPANQSLLRVLSCAPSGWGGPGKHIRWTSNRYPLRQISPPTDVRAQRVRSTSEARPLYERSESFVRANRVRCTSDVSPLYE